MKTSSNFSKKAGRFSSVCSIVVDFVVKLCSEKIWRNKAKKNTFSI
uniref:Uncharacterized protein n=1 Tax=Siphoviridae sp. ctuvC1 TaxID=2826507 RepID=A0A8S5LZS2_9CAUD|nr:MAG TPA: hypothetical protein [Siphoviridae sp. ctuvC1]